MKEILWRGIFDLVLHYPGGQTTEHILGFIIFLKTSNCVMSTSASIHHRGNVL